MKDGYDKTFVPAMWLSASRCRLRVHATKIGIGTAICGLHLEVVGLSCRVGADRQGVNLAKRGGVDKRIERRPEADIDAIRRHGRALLTKNLLCLRALLLFFNLAALQGIARPTLADLRIHVCDFGVVVCRCGRSLALLD